MKNFDWKSYISILLMCGIVTYGVFHLTKFSERYAENHSQQKFSKKGKK